MRKVFISFLALLTIFISSVSIPQKAQAAAPVLTRVVGGTVGERIIIGIGEKAGIKYTSKKATEEAVERWNLEIYKKIQEAEQYGRDLEAEDYRKLQEMLKSKKVEDLEKVDTGSKNNPGVFGKAVISTAAFLTGLDIILDMRQEYVDAINNKEMLEKVTDYQEKIESGEAMTAYGPYTFWVQEWGYDQKATLWFGAKGATENQYPLANYNMETIRVGDPYSGVILSSVLNKDTGQLNVKVSFTYTDYSEKKVYTDTKGLALPALDTLKYPNGDIIPDYNKVNFQPDPSNLPSVPSVPWVTPWRDNPETDKPILPDTVPIEVPLSDPDIYNPGEPWNEPLPEYEPNPEPGDQPDKDYIPGIPVNPTPTPGTDSPTVPDPGGNTNPNPESPTVPEPGGNTEPVSPTTPGTPGTPTPDPPGNGKDGPVKTDPLSWIWIFIKFLIAIIMFLLRLAKFIITIPLVPAEQFPGVYGEMVSTFMNLKYGNIYPYKIMISVVNLAFGFVVYKILRRMFNG